MILRSARVRDFKSIADSGEVDLAGRVSCLLGKNESGKTAFLEALYRLNPAPTGHPSRFEIWRDFPRHRVARERESAGEAVPVTATFTLEDHDVEEIESALGPGSLGSRDVIAWRRYGGELEVEVEISEQAAVRHLAERAGLEQERIDDVDELRAALQAKVAPTEEQAEIAAVVEDLDLPGAAAGMVARRLPRFLYFDEYSELPGRVSIAHLRSADEEELTPRDRTALSLLRLAGVDADDFAGDAYEGRRAALESAAAALTDEVFRYWSQNDDLRVVLDLDHKRPGDGGSGHKPPYLDLRIESVRHFVTLNFDQRSKGFQWFFSFMTAFSEVRGTPPGLVLLLDEPGLGLHPAGQADLLRYVDEALAAEHEVVYTTHSPFMIDVERIERVRLVEDHDLDGTTVTADLHGLDPSTAAPLRSAVAQELVRRVPASTQTLLVAGLSDLVILQAMSDALHERGRDGLDPVFDVTPVGTLAGALTAVALAPVARSVALVPSAWSQLASGLDEVVVRGALEAQQLEPLSLHSPVDCAELEDLVDPELYLDMLFESGITDERLPMRAEDESIVSYAERRLGRRFDRYRPAALLLGRPSEWRDRLDDTTLERFAGLFSSLNARAGGPRRVRPGLVALPGASWGVGGAASLG